MGSFEELTRFIGKIECDNPFTRSPGHLVLNTLFGFGCAFVAFAVCMVILGECTRISIRCLRSHYAESQQIQQEQQEYQLQILQNQQMIDPEQRVDHLEAYRTVVAA